MLSSNYSWICYRGPNVLCNILSSNLTQLATFTQNHQRHADMFVVYGSLYYTIHMGALSLCTGLQVNNPAARLPYSKIQQYGILIEGLPEGKTLKHPSSYGPHTLKAILSSKDSIKLKGIIMHTLFSTDYRLSTIPEILEIDSLIPRLSQQHRNKCK